MAFMSAVEVLDLVGNTFRANCSLQVLIRRRLLPSRTPPPRLHLEIPAPLRRSTVWTKTLTYGLGRSGGCDPKCSRRRVPTQSSYNNL